MTGARVRLPASRASRVPCKAGNGKGARAFHITPRPYVRLMSTSPQRPAAFSPRPWRIIVAVAW